MLQQRRGRSTDVSISQYGPDRKSGKSGLVGGLRSAASRYSYRCGTPPLGVGRCGFAPTYVATDGKAHGFLASQAHENER